MPYKLILQNSFAYTLWLWRLEFNPYASNNLIKYIINRLPNTEIRKSPS